MMTLSVAEDFPIPQPLVISSWYKALFIASISTAASIVAFSLAQLGTASHYTSPIAASLTALHSAVLWYLCYREILREPSYNPRTRRRLPTTRRLNLFATLVLEFLWTVVIVFLVIYVSRTETLKERALAVVELVLAGIQGCVTLALGLRCLHERMSVLRPPNAQRARRSTNPPRRPSSGRWFPFN